MLAEQRSRSTMPMTFCATAASVEITKNTRTSGPPTRSSDTLAPKPTDVKNAIISGVCSVVSRVTSVDAALPRHADDDRDQQAADDRRRNVVARERGNQPLDAVAGEQDHAGKGERTEIESRDASRITDLTIGRVTDPDRSWTVPTCRRDEAAAIVPTLQHPIEKGAG